MSKDVKLNELYNVVAKEKPYSLLWLELLQRAKFSGAKNIEIFHDKDYIRIEDDGKPLKSFQENDQWVSSRYIDDLSEAKIFYYLLYVKSLQISSGQYYIQAEQGMLSVDSFSLILHQSEKYLNGSRAELFGVDENFKFPEEIFEGFPVNIILNNYDLDRPDAEENYNAWTAYKFCRLKRIKPCDISDVLVVKCYYQGILVYKDDNPFHRSECVVHLSDLGFSACYLDEVFGIEPIKDTIHRHIKKEMERIFRDIKYIDPEFLCQNYSSYQVYDLDYLFNDLDYLPGHILHRVHRLPMNSVHKQDSDFLISLSGFLDKDSIIEGRVKLYNVNTCIEVGETFNSLMFLYKSDNAYIIDINQLCENHWVSEYVIDIDERSVSVELEKGFVSQGTGIPSQYLTMKCEFYILSIFTEKVICDEPALLDIYHEYDYLPAELGRGDEPVRPVVVIPFNKEKNLSGLAKQIFYKNNCIKL